MHNPFVYGEVVPAAAFVDRVVELDRLVDDLAAGQKVFLISPRRYGKSSLIRHALAAIERRGALTVEVTVSSFSSYVAFLEGYARALVAAESRWDRARTWLREVIRSARAEIRVAAKADPLGTHHRVVSQRAIRPRRLAAGPGGVRAAGAAGRSPQAQGRRRARRVPGDRRLQRRLGRARAARRGPASARGRLRVRRLGAEPDGADARTAAPVLQGRAGDAPRRRFPADEFAAFIEVRFDRVGDSRRSRDSAPRSSSSPATCPTTCSASPTRPGTTFAPAARRRATLDDLHQALRRLLAEQQTMFEALWQRLTLRSARCCARWCSRTAASCCPPTCASGIASAARPRSRPRSPRCCATMSSRATTERYVVVDSLLREWVARKTF